MNWNRLWNSIKKVTKASVLPAIILAIFVVSVYAGQQGYEALGGIGILLGVFISAVAFDYVLLQDIGFDTKKKSK